MIRTYAERMLIKSRKNNAPKGNGTKVKNYRKTSPTQGMGNERRVVNYESPRKREVISGYHADDIAHEHEEDARVEAEQCEDVWYIAQPEPSYDWDDEYSFDRRTEKERDEDDAWGIYHDFLSVDAHNAELYYYGRAG